MYYIVNSIFSILLILFQHYTLRLIIFVQGSFSRVVLITVNSILTVGVSEKNRGSVAENDIKLEKQICKQYVSSSWHPF